MKKITTRAAPVSGDQLTLNPPDDGIALIDAAGHFTYMNAAHRLMFGIAADDDIGKLHWQQLYQENILRSNGAALRVQTPPHRGTTVTISWPQAVALGQAAAADLVGCNILIVDDRPDAADRLALLIEARGAVCATTPDMAEAAALLRDHRHVWSAVVGDVDLDSDDGRALAAMAQQGPRAVPVVLVTPSPERYDPAAGEFAALTGPRVDFATMLATLQRVCLHRPGRGGGQG